MRRLHAALLLLTATLLGCDQATKAAAQATLGPASATHSVGLIDGVVELKYEQNPDTAFSLLRTFGIAHGAWLMLALSSFALAAVITIWIASRKRLTTHHHIGFALVLAGALGNVLDRAVHTYVIDFIHVTRWPIFNVADIAVVLGILLLAFARGRPRPAIAGSAV